MTPHTETNTGEKFNVPGRSCPPIPLSALKAATNDFAESFVIGEGGFAKVYKGEICIRDRAVTVAIKRLNDKSPEFRKDFEKEILMVSEFRHHNLVSLIGYCDDSDEMILIYEYMDGGTLEDSLHKIGNNLSWLECLKLCTGAARALDYLHTGTAVEIIHRDVKSSNILLDAKRTTARISDFGISKIRPDPDTGVSTKIQGTFGYVDPVYSSTGDLTGKSDVYSFGVVLFEVLCGRPAVDRTLPKENWNLGLWAKSCIERGKVEQIIDPKFESQILKTSLSEFVKVAFKCLHSHPNERPTMTTVLAGLELALKNQECGKGKATASSPVVIKKFFKNIKRPFRPKTSKSATASAVAAPNDLRSAPNIELIAVSSVQLDELKEITNNFDANFLICEGPYAKLYQCIMKSGQASFIRFDFNELSDKEFLDQVSMVSKLQHENLVKLLRYCVDGGLHVLAYDYAPNGSLHDVLHGQKGAQPVQFLSWPQRVKIAVGVAKGLQYLHEGRSNPIIRCEITSMNVLLFDDYVPKIAYFNLQSQVQDMEARSCSDHFLLFTLEDHASEYGMSTQIFVDIYSFGVVLLELLTGRKPHDYALPFREQYLVKWATPQLSGEKLKQCIDPRLCGKYPLWQAKKMAAVASLCLRDEPTERPSMSIVVEELESLLDLPGPSSTAIRSLKPLERS